MSFTCTFFSPVTVMFVAVKDSPKLGEPCVTDSCSTRSGSRTGTLYFGSPAELPCIRVLIKTDVLFIHQLIRYGIHVIFRTISSQRQFGHNGDHFQMQQVVRIFTTTITVNTLSMTISLVSCSGQWRHLCRTTQLQDCRSLCRTTQLQDCRSLCRQTQLQDCRSFRQVASSYHVLSLETFHIPATSLCFLATPHKLQH